MFAPGMNERQSRVDWLQILGLFGLMVVGVLFIYSATMAHETTVLPWYRERWFMQIVWYAAGAVAAGVLCLVDYHTLARWAFVA